MLKYCRGYGDFWEKRGEILNCYERFPWGESRFSVLYNGQDVPTIEELHNNKPNKTDQWGCIVFGNKKGHVFLKLIYCSYIWLKTVICNPTD